VNLWLTLIRMVPYHGVSTQLGKKSNNVKKAVVCGAGGFIGGHLVKKLKRVGYWVRGIDSRSMSLRRLRPMSPCCLM
jgi:hypothetical protein